MGMGTTGIPINPTNGYQTLIYIHHELNIFRISNQVQGFFVDADPGSLKVDGYIGYSGSFTQTLHLRHMNLLECHLVIYSCGSI